MCFIAIGKYSCAYQVVRGHARKAFPHTPALRYNIESVLRYQMTCSATNKLLVFSCDSTRRVIT